MRVPPPAETVWNQISRGNQFFSRFTFKIIFFGGWEKRRFFTGKHRFSPCVHPIKKEYLYEDTHIILHVREGADANQPGRKVVDVSLMQIRLHWRNEHRIPLCV